LPSLAYFSAASRSAGNAPGSFGNPLWDQEALAWARSVYDDPRVAAKRAEFIEIQRRLKSTRPGPERTALVREEGNLGRVRFGL
jgi:hypothetical protein